MAEQALYRKYRSADFSQVLGQDHIVTTLVSAIANDRLSHAYLFTGPRGTGKTSVARLLARALNCTGTGMRPCNECANCKAIINSSLDVVEIDAASNRSIDSIRDLREKVALAPAIGRHKIYIIDEVHMLTSEAFNALLKTLEEPPAHAVFILATTEAHKVPETIISRTQRFSFRPIPTPEIVKHLVDIAAGEKVEVEPAALELIAVGARGGFRDAISAFDQVASSGQRPVTVEVVRTLLGYSDGELIGTVSRAIATSDARAAVVGLADLVAGGAQPGQLAIQLIEQWRAIMLAATGASEPTPGVVAELAAIVSPARAAMVVAGLIDATRSGSPREALEAAVVLLSSASDAAAPLAAPAPVAAVAKPAAKTAPVSPSAAPSAANEPPSQPDLNAATDAERWPKVVMLIKQKHNSLAALLAMYPIEVSGGAIVIKSRFNFHRDLFMKSQNRSAIEAIVEKVYGRAMPVTAVTEEGPVKAAPRAQVDSSAELISSALEILGGEVVE
ncbi:DNA polymerase III subunit gamma/tau [Candidatus Saccharibacteria bacterium]|nr:DNA polymerase III subunit gamma/tau [Candidatus Saccharibacteria bacterium]